ncbi:MAG: hypothetical protein AAF824_06500 [Bacteroidota bacterium]
MRYLPCLFLLLGGLLLWSCQEPVPIYGIAYITDLDGDFNIYYTDQNGENHHQLTANPGMDWAPAWDEAGKRIIHYATDTSQQFLILSKSLLGEEIPLNTEGLSEYILSPDGHMALFTLKDSLQQFIYAYQVKSGDSLELVTHPSYNGRPSWSPDSKWISFISDRHGNNELFALRVEDGSLKRLTYTPGREKYHSWSADGSTIFYTMASTANQNNIFQVKLATAESVALTADTLLYEELACSPDGKKLAYHTKKDCEHHIYTMNLDGTGEQKITQQQAYHGEPEWIVLPSEKNP